MKKIFRLSLLFISSFVSLIVIYLFVAGILSFISIGKETNDSKDVSIYILTNGVHTDLVLPLRNEQTDWSKYIHYKNTTSKDTLARFVALGWGDKGFYLETPTWDQLKFTTAFKAATGLSSSAIHATFYRNMKEDDDCIKIEISKEQYARLIKYIHSSFRTDPFGNFIHIKTNNNYGKNDAFYEAGGSYSLFHTCNTWTNNGLKSCGQKSCLWTPFDKGIFYHYKSDKQKPA